MSSRTIVIQMEITKEFDLERHQGVLNKTMVKAITLLELKFSPFLKRMMLLRRIIHHQRMKWWLK